MKSKIKSTAVWFLAAVWTLGWSAAYLAIEVRRQWLAPLGDTELLGWGHLRFPWPVAEAIAWLVVLAAAFAQIGGWLTARLRVSAIARPDSDIRRLYALEEWALSFSFGAIAAGLAVLGLGLAGVWFPWIVFPVLALASWPLWIVVALVLTMAAKAAARGRIAGSFFRRHELPRSDLARALFWLQAVLLLFGLLYTLTPPIQSDGLRYHLAAPQEYIKTGQILYLPYSAFSNFPFLIEMLFTLGLATGNDLVAKGIHWLLLAVSALWIYLLAAQALWWRRPFEPPAQRRTSLAGLASLAFVATPAVLIVGCWEFIDLGIAALFFAFVYALCRWMHSRTRGWLAAVGIFGGGCLGTKYTMIPLVGLGALWVFAVSLTHTECDAAKPLRVAARRFLFVIGIAGALAAPWYLKNLVMTGNPVYPMAWGLFGGGEWNRDNASFYIDKAAGKGFTRQIKEGPAELLTALVQLPYATAFRWRNELPATDWQGFEDHNIGVGYLLLTPFLIGWVIGAVWRWRRDPVRATIALFSLAYGGLWFFTYQSNRFLIPLLGLACVMAADAARGLDDWAASSLGGAASGLSGAATGQERPGGRWYSPGRWVWNAILAATTLNAIWTVRWVALDPAHEAPLPVALGFQSRDEYLFEALPQYSLLSRLDEYIDRRDQILFIGEHRGYYCKAHYLTSDWYDTPRVLALIRETPDNDALFDRLLSDNVRYVLFNFDELEKYLGIFQSRFTQAEWNRFMDFCQSPRLRRRLGSSEKIFLAEIRPR